MAPIYAGYYAVTETAGPAFDMHYGLEFGIILTGRARRYFRSWQTEVGPGQAWYCGIFEPHGWELLAVPCDHLVLIMLPEVLAAAGVLADPQHDLLAPFTVPPEKRPVVTGETRQRVMRLGQYFLSKMGQRWERLWTTLLTVELLSVIQSEWVPPSSQPAVVPQFHEVVNKAVRLVLEAQQPVTTEQAARACAVSERAFRRSFRALVGMPFKRFELRHRVSGAAGQLLRTGEPAKAIASDWGFTDVSHFHRCFARHYGCSPGAYRKQAEKHKVPVLPTPELWSALWDVQAL